MTRVRFAPSPTGPLHVGNALCAVANRNFGGTLILRIDDTDRERNVAGAAEAIADALVWLGVEWDEGPLLQSDRDARYAEAARALVARGHASDGDDGAVRARGDWEPTLLRPDGSATYALASVVDDADYRITHVIRGKDHLDKTGLQTRLIEALAGQAPEFVHHGLVLGADGRKLSKREPLATIADLREAGVPEEAVRKYLDNLGIPVGDVHYDVARIRSLSTEVLESLSDDELARRAEIPVEVVPAVRGAHDLEEVRAIARSILDAQPGVVGEEARPTLERLRELVAGNGLDAKAIIRELKAVGGDLRAVRVALTGRDRGPALWTVLRALPREETLRRVDAAL